ISVALATLERVLGGIGNIAIVAIPVVIGVLGYQAAERQKSVENERAEFDRLNVVMDRLTNEKPAARLEALNVLADFIDAKQCEFPQLIVPALAQATGDSDPTVSRQARKVMVVAINCPGPEVSKAISRAMGYSDNIAEAVHITAQTNPIVTAKLDQHPNDLPKRVYIQIKDDSQKADATNIQKQLRDNGFVAPGIEIVGAKMPLQTELRYFRTSDEKQALELTQLIQHGAQKKFIPGWETKAPLNQYELWLAPPPAKP